MKLSQLQIGMANYIQTEIADKATGVKNLQYMLAHF